MNSCEICPGWQIERDVEIWSRYNELTIRQRGGKLQVHWPLTPSLCCTYNWPGRTYTHTHTAWNDHLCHCDTVISSPKDFLCIEAPELKNCKKWGRKSRHFQVSLGGKELSRRVTTLRFLVDKTTHHLSFLTKSAVFIISLDIAGLKKKQIFWGRSISPPL